MKSTWRSATVVRVTATHQVAGTSITKANRNGWFVDNTILLTKKYNKNDNDTDVNINDNSNDKNSKRHLLSCLKFSLPSECTSTPIVSNTQQRFLAINRGGGGGGGEDCESYATTNTTRYKLTTGQKLTTKRRSNSNSINATSLSLLLFRLVNIYLPKILVVLATMILTQSLFLWIVPTMNDVTIYRTSKKLYSRSNNNYAASTSVDTVPATIDISINSVLTAIVAYIHSSIQPINDTFWKLPTVLLLLFTSLLSAKSTTDSTRHNDFTIQRYISSFFTTRCSGHIQILQQQSQQRHSPTIGLFTPKQIISTTRITSSIVVLYILYSIVTQRILQSSSSSLKRGMYNLHHHCSSSSSSNTNMTLGLRYNIHNVPLYLIDEMSNVCESIIDKIRYTIPELIDENDNEFPNTPLMAHWIGYYDTDTNTNNDNDNDSSGNSSRNNVALASQRGKVGVGISRGGVNIYVEAHVRRLPAYKKNGTEKSNNTLHNNNNNYNDEHMNQKMQQTIMDAIRDYCNNNSHIHIMKRKDEGKEFLENNHQYWIEPLC